MHQHDHSREELSLIGQLIKNETLSLKIIDKLTHKAVGVKQVLTIFIDNQKFILMSLLLKPGKRYSVSPALIDAVNLAPVPGATFVSKSNSVDNPSVAVVDADGKVAYVGKGTANLTTVNTWTYNDELTGDPVTQDLTTTVQITALSAAEVVTQTVDLTGEEDIPAATPPVTTP